MRITNSNFYLIAITALAALIIIGLYYFSRKGGCCGECHVHGQHAMERTFAMIKPDAVAAGKADEIIQAIKDRGFTIVAQKETTLDKETAEKLYAIHKDKPFFHEAISFITSGPVILLALEKDNAIKEWRDAMGSTSPQEAAAGTLRSLYGIDAAHNALHGSDSVQSAHQELNLFFPGL
jgi:nucleoside-diphosphate kinase